jgi:hypothetical protein
MLECSGCGTAVMDSGELTVEDQHFCAWDCLSDFALEVSEAEAA